MDADAQKFLEAEAEAERLVVTLEKLQAEAGSYQTARTDLSTVAARLSTLITATKDIAADTHQAVRTLQSIGGPEILHLLRKLDEQSRTEHMEQARKLTRTTTLLLIAVPVAIIAALASLISLFM